MTRVHAFTDDALGELDTVGLVAALHDRKVSIPEVVEAAIARCERMQPHLNGLALATYDRARHEARAPRGGYFAGVPTLIKDNVEVAGLPTQHGTDAFRSRPAAEHGDFARMYLATGPIPIGKTQLSEFGFSASAEHPRLGAVRNPWHVEYSAGASSSGSAAFVAAGVVPIAHANDGGGSIRIPAAVNGLVGLKPTRDRLAQDKLSRDMPVRLVVDGVVTRSVRDTAAFLRESERVWRNPRLTPVGDVTGPSRQRLRIAVITRGIARDVDPAVVAETRRVAELLAGLGHQVEDVEPPVDQGFADDFLLYWSMLSLYLLRTGRIAFGPTFRRDRTDNLTRGLAAHCTRGLHRLPGAIRRLARSEHTAAKFFGDWDATLSPTLGTPTPRLGHLDPTQDYDTVMDRLLDWVAFTPYHNATGEPAISLPLATDPQGLPLGMMFGAAAGREATLLGLAYELEEAAPWRGIQDAV